jgi:hypothetical protein
MRLRGWRVRINRVPPAPDDPWWNRLPAWQGFILIAFAVVFLAAGQRLLALLFFFAGMWALIVARRPRQR